jgi:rhodanese-related sulfurtransferase
MACASIIEASLFGVDYSSTQLNTVLMKVLTDPQVIRQEIYDKLASVALALASPGRLKIIQLLAQSPFTVEELSVATGQSVANTSQHLQRLAHEGLVSVTKMGLRRIYQVKHPGVIALWESLQDLAHELSPSLDRAEDALTDFSLRTEMPNEEVLREVARGRATLLDVRDEKEAVATPVEGAVAIPLDQLKKRMKELPKSKPVFAFCRGRYCALASNAVNLLRHSGFKAFRLRESSFRLRKCKEEA